jgi:prepilin-type N-terminal cleavage/methylation domain-containing protein
MTHSASPAKPPSRHRPSSHSDRGFSLLEITISIAIVSVALAGLAPVLVQCTMMLASSRSETRAWILARSRIEQLSALAFEQRADTLALVTDESADLSSVPPTSHGSGLAAGDASTSWTDTSGFVDWTSVDGRPAAPRSTDAAFVRRWAVDVENGVPPDRGRLLLVFSRDGAGEGRERGRVSAARRTGDVWLFTARSRTLR